MSMFDSIINEASEKFNLGGKTGTLLSALLALITTKSSGGFAGFIEKFNAAGLGSLVSSWISSGSNMPISNEQLESALGRDEIQNIANQTGTDYDTAAAATAYMTPHVVDSLTPDGNIPQESDLLTRIGGYLTGIGVAASDGIGITTASVGGFPDKAEAAIGNTYDDAKRAVGGGVDTVGDTAGAVGDRFGGAVNRVSDSFDDNDNGSVLKWLIPLLLLGLLLALGYWFCGKSTPVVTNTNTNTNANVKANTVNTNVAKAVESSFRLEAKDGKYTVTGIVKDEATKKQIMQALDAQYGAGNVNYDGLKVDANAKDFGPGWWANFQKLLPDLKDWKTGALAFTGSAITEASGVPGAIMDKIKSLFTGWTFPTVSTPDAPRTLTEVSLPSGEKLQAYPGGIEDQLIKFIQSDEYKNGTADTLKDKWFSFDDLNFEFGTTTLVPTSKRQLDNITAILKAFPDVKIKIGGYTDKKGNDAANKKLSDDRAKAVKAALEKAGVGAQVPEAEGYGEEFAKVPETASDKEREADRKTSVRLLK